MKFVFRNIEDVLAFHEGGALADGMSIGHEFYTSDLAVATYSDHNPILHIIDTGCIAVKEFSGLEAVSISDLLSKCKGLDLADCSVLFFAMVTGATVISAERIIVNACNTHKIKAIVPNSYLQKFKIYERR